jgi:hypothetical protein
MIGATDTPSTKPSLELPVERGVVIVTFDSAQILDVTGPLEVFSSASRFLPAVRYRTRRSRRGRRAARPCPTARG